MDRSRMSCQTLIAASLVTLGGAAVHAQTCTPEFAAGFEYAGVTNGTVNASIMYDAQDGNGPRLYIAGKFDRAGGRQCNGIAMWDGTSFQPLGGGLPANNLASAVSGTVYDLEVLDPDGDGPIKPDLWACGNFTRAKQANGTTITVRSIARWHGDTQTWHLVNTNGLGTEIFDMLADEQVGGDFPGRRMYIVHRNGDTSPSPYIAAYTFDTTQGEGQVNLAHIDGTPLDGGLWNTLTKYNGRVYFGGWFSQGVARMNSDGVTFEFLPENPRMAYSGTGDTDPAAPVGSMVVWNNRLLIAPANPSAFGLSENVPLESFDGTSWQNETFGALGTTAFTTAQLSVIDLGDGPKLYFGDKYRENFGFNLSNGGSQGALPQEFNGGAVWDGTTLSPFAQGVYGMFGDHTAKITTFTKTTHRGQPAIFVGGHFAGAQLSASARVAGNGALFWNGSTFIPQFEHAAQGGFPGNDVIQLDGVNDRMIINGSSFLGATSFSDGNNPGGIVAYDGESWANSSIPRTNFAESVRYIRYNPGSGEALYAAGSEMLPDGVSRPAEFSLSRWDGSQWVNVSTGASLPGSTAAGLPAAANVVATVFDTDGPGPLNSWIILGGYISISDTFPTAVPTVVAYDGSTWHAMSNGIAMASLTGRTETLSFAAFDDGSGLKLYVSASLSGVPGSVFRYDGTGDTGTWTPVGFASSSFSQTPVKIRVVNLGSGPQLLAFGYMADMSSSSTPNPTPTGPLARWNGTEWISLGAAPLAKIHTSSPFAASINDVAAFDDGAGVQLYITGPFGSVAGVPARGLAKLVGDSWTAIGTGLNSYTFSTGNTPDNLRMSPSSLTVFDDDASGPSRPALYIGGSFDNASGVYSQSFARYGCPKVTCIADFNNSGSVTVQDIFDFLAGWFAGNAAADINNSGSVTVQDIFDFLAAWFAGCA